MRRFDPVSSVGLRARAICRRRLLLAALPVQQLGVFLGFAILFLSTLVKAVVRFTWHVRLRSIAAGTDHKRERTCTPNLIVEAHRMSAERDGVSLRLQLPCSTGLLQRAISCNSPLGGAHGRHPTGHPSAPWCPPDSRELYAPPACARDGAYLAGGQACGPHSQLGRGAF